MPRRKPRVVPKPPGPRRPDREHVPRLVETLLHLGAYDKRNQLRPAWTTLYDLVDIPGTPAPSLPYHFRFGGLPSEDPDQLTDLLLNEWEDRAAEVAA